MSLGPQQSTLDFGQPPSTGTRTADHADGGFHPAVAAWLRERHGEPTEVQRRAWAITAPAGAALPRRDALIAAPTGSGKTLAAFLGAINALVLRGLQAPSPDAVQASSPGAVQVLYVSPLKALSNDIRKNLQEPLEGIRRSLVERGLADVDIRAAVRTGDTPMAERERMRREPPQILVTTPESLYILLTSNAGRRMLRAVQSVIVDELHAVAGSKRGAHLMLSLQRLDALVEEGGGARPQRIGLSATVKPIDEMAAFLVGVVGEGDTDAPAVEIVDTGHVRRRDLALELPRSPLASVMATEVWAETYDRLAELVAAHRTTLVFVNQRRLAERAARHLAERLGEAHVTAHHGSLSREHRLQAEQRLKSGQLKALVATSSLELGIDIGDVDLVCQLGSPRGINAFLQRVGRAGHAVGAVPKGRLFPLATDDLLECAALLHAVAQGELDRIRVPVQPLDALAQQVVAEAACREWPLDALYALLRRAAPYRALSLKAFEDVVQMLADGYSTRRGRRGAYLHYDAVNRIVRARRGAKLTAVTNAGVIPDQFDYEVVLLPEEHRIGTLNEDFAFESLPGDIFQLGNASYRIAKIETGKVMVEDAKGQPPTMPFWFGEGLGRSDELCLAVSRLNERAQALLDAPGGEAALAGWLRDELQLPGAAVQQLVLYMAASKAALGVLPGHSQIVFERFFDEVGDTHLVIHSPFGSRINKAWGLALRKRMCRKFNFELQASALDDSIVLSLGPTHSFPLDELKHYLKPATAKHILIQALLDAPMFGTRWRWAATAALAVRRMSGGRKVPPPFQRADAQDLLTVVFPEQQACLENIVGERELPEHPLVEQTLHDCLHEVMDVDGFVQLLARIEAGEVRVQCCELASPSPMAHAILNAKPYAFLDGGEAEERRTRAVRTQPLRDVQSAAELGRIDPEAIAQVIDEARPVIVSADELHDALVLHGFLTAAELGALAGARGDEWLAELQAQRRAARSAGVDTGADTEVDADAAGIVVAAERLHELAAVCPALVAALPLPPLRAELPEREAALRELLRSRLDLLGPTTAGLLGAPLALSDVDVQLGLLALEAEGAVMRGAFTPAARARGVEGSGDEWCERRLLARMHRYSRDRQRAQVQAVAPATFMRFLLRWQQVGAGAASGHAGHDERREGEAGLEAVLAQLEGVAAPAGAWEEELLAVRVKHYAPELLDRLCAAGRISWWRPLDSDGARAGATKQGPIRATPVMLGERASLPHWQRAAAAEPDAAALSGRARRLRDVLRAQGASFFSDLQHDAGMLGVEVEQALAELVAHGLVTCDSFAGLRALLMPSEQRRRAQRRRPGSDVIDDAGRWSLTRRPRVVVPQAGSTEAAGEPEGASTLHAANHAATHAVTHAASTAGAGAVDSTGALADAHVEHIARVLLRRWGVVFRRLLEREDGLPTWRELFYVYRRLEARGEVRGGRFVSGFSGEQFALPEAASALRRLAQEEQGGSVANNPLERVSISAADPLNLIGILLPGDKLPRLPGNRLLFEGGVPIALQLGGEVHYLKPLAAAAQWEAKNLLIRRQRPGSWLPPPAAAQ